MLSAQCRQPVGGFVCENLTLHRSTERLVRLLLPDKYGEFKPHSKPKQDKPNVCSTLPDGT